MAKRVESFFQGNMMNVLVVDDDHDIREMIVAMVRHMGHRPFGLRHGREALEALWRTIDIDIVICDLLMPEMDGYELISHLRSAGCSLPIIVVTGIDRADPVQGADLVLHKPLRMRQLADALGRCTPSTKGPHTPH